MLTDRHDIRYALPMNTRMNIELPAFKDNGHLFHNGFCRGLLLLAIVRGKTVGTFKTVTLYQEAVHKLSHLHFWFSYNL